jgi:phosphatidylserine decarboxylase
MGRFKLGSTAVVLFPGNSMNWLEEFTAGTPTVMGQAFASLNTPSNSI